MSSGGHAASWPRCRRGSARPGQRGGPPAPLAGDDDPLAVGLVPADPDRLELAPGLQARGQVGQRLRVELLPGLVGVGDDPLELDRQRVLRAASPPGTSSAPPWSTPAGRGRRRRRPAARPSTPSCCRRAGPSGCRRPSCDPPFGRGAPGDVDPGQQLVGQGLIAFAAAALRLVVADRLAGRDRLLEVLGQRDRRGEDVGRRTARGACAS